MFPENWGAHLFSCLVKSQKSGVLYTFLWIAYVITFWLFHSAGLGIAF